MVGDNGFVSYPQTCQFVEAEAATVFDRDSRVPYAFKNSEWISYDDERSLAYKVCATSSIFVLWSNVTQKSNNIIRNYR